MIKLIYSYSLPPGSALILVAFVGTMLTLTSITLTSVEYAFGNLTSKLHLNHTYYEDDGPDPNDYHATLIIIAMLLSLEIIADVIFLGYGVILKGNPSFLKVWRGYRLVMFGMFMLYFALGLFVLIHDLLQGFGVNGGEHAANIFGVYCAIYLIVYYSYELNLTKLCRPLLSSPQTMTDLMPVGKGLSFIVDYYRSNPVSAAGLALMTEIMFNVHEIVWRHVTEYAIGVDHDDEISRSTALTIENTLGRYIRVAVCITGFCFVRQEAQQRMLRWCYAYFSAILLSLGVFIYMIITWNVTYTMFTGVEIGMFAISLLYRCGILYLCVRYSRDLGGGQQRDLPLDETFSSLCEDI